MTDPSTEEPSTDVPNADVPNAGEHPADDASDPRRPTVTASEFGMLPIEQLAEHAAQPQGELHDKPHDKPRDPNGLPQPGDVIAERYRIEHELDRGGMGAVYEATQIGKRQHLRRVALKWLLDNDDHRVDRRRRFLREARALGSIQHPNVVRVYDAGEHDNGVFMVMELLEGESLRICMQRTTFTAAQAVDLLMPALRGIAAVHKKGIVHRDLKPANIFVCKGDGAQPTIKVLDFGLSKLLGPNADSLETLPGAMLGTPQYMAPEQALGQPVDARSDIYSLGVILYEAVAGCRPFEALTLAGLLAKLAQAEPPHLLLFAKTAPAGFAEAVMHALHREPARRPSSVEAFARELGPYGTQSFVSGEMYSRLSRLSAPFLASAPARSPQARRITWWIAAAVAAALLAGLAAHRRSTVRDAERAQANALAAEGRAQSSTAAPSPIVSKPIGPSADATVEPAPAPIAPAAPPATAIKKPARRRTAQSSQAPSRPQREARPARPSRDPRRMVGIVDPWEEERPDPWEGIRKDDF